MKKLLLIALLLFSCRLMAQTHAGDKFDPNYHMAKLVHTDGTQEPVLAYPATKEYVKCDGPRFPKIKLLAGERLKLVACKCLGAATTFMGLGTASPTYGNIQFEFNSSVLKASSYSMLDAASADLKSSGKTLTLAGYASSEGTAAYNMRLARDRAMSVKTYLVNSGVDARRLKIKAFGEAQPIADNSTEEGRILNRRVELR